MGGDLIFGLGQVVEVRDWETAELVLNQITTIASLQEPLPSRWGLVCFF
jgi:hypothetical protein